MSSISAAMPTATSTPGATSLGHDDVLATAIPLRDLLPWVLFVVALALALAYVVGVEQGAVSLLNGAGVHEWVHDGRHLLGFPCH